MKKVLKSTIKGALFALLLVSTSGCSNKKGNSQILKIDSVNLNESSLILDYLENQTVDFSAAKVDVSYDDGSKTQCTIDASGIGQIETGLGVHDTVLTFNVEQSTYDFTVYYTIYSTQNELNVSKKIKAIPAINTLGLENVEEIIAIRDEYNLLTDEEKTFLKEYVTIVVDTLNNAEDYLIDIYFADRVNDLKVFYDTINKAAYKAEDLDKIKEFYQSFCNATFTSLRQIKETYNQTKDSINAIQRKSIPLSDYKKLSISFLKEFMITHLYSVENINEVWTAKQNTVDLFENPLLTEPLTAIFDEINFAGDTDEIDALYKKAYEKIQELFTSAYADDAIKNLEDLYLSLKSMIADDLARWEGDTIDLIGMFENITVDYINDNRWWIPDPFKIGNILTEGGEKLKTVPVSQVTQLYEDLAMEITKATLMKNAEMVYTINRNFNKAYDTDNGYYWSIISDRWGAGPDRQMIYDGPLDSYKNNLYGTSDSNPVRLCSRFYGWIDGTPGGRTIQELIDLYVEMMIQVAPDPLAVSSTTIKKAPNKLQYLAGEQLDLSGGIVTVNYNDLTSADLNMTNDMAYIYDMAKVGSQTITLKFKDPKLDEDTTALLDIIILSGDTRFDTIINKINALPEVLTKDNIDDIQEIVSLLENLGDERAEFEETFASEITKLNNAQKALVKVYYEEGLVTRTFNFETMNLCAYDDAEAIETLFNNTVGQIKNASTFKEIDECFESYDAALNGYHANTTDLATFKAKSIESLDRITTVKLDKFVGKFYEVERQIISLNLKETYDDVAAKVTQIESLINEAGSVNDVEQAYANNVASLLALTIEKYQIEATNNAKQAILDIRQTISDIWAGEDEETFTVTGEAGEPIFINYTEDMGGYYVWYTPLSYHTDMIYNGLSVNGNVQTKADLYDNYQFCLFDAARSAFFRNLMITYFYHTNAGHEMIGTMWNTLFFCDGTFTYDGCLEAFEGQVYQEMNFRLWRYGWHITDRVYTLDELLYHYNVDLGLFMNINIAG